MAILVERKLIDEYCDEARNCTVVCHGILKHIQKLRNAIGILEQDLIHRIKQHEQYVEKFRKKLDADSS